MALSVALNGRFSGTLQPTGTQTVAYNLFDAIIRDPARQVPLVVFADPTFPGVAEWPDIKATRLVPIPFSRWSRGRAQLWEQFMLPRSCREAEATIAHHPMTTSPARKRGVRSIVTLHDLNFCLHPSWYSKSFRAVYQMTALPGLKSADLVVAVSDFVRDKAEEHLHLPRARLRRIYNGVKTLPPRTAAARRVAGVSYVLCVGSLQPHKNLRRIVEAFEVVSIEWPDLELWVAGRTQPGFRCDDEERSISHPKVKLLGYLPEDELFDAYANAAVFCYPSIEEGFGLPILEAMQAGVPVVTSSASCLPEIAADAAEMADPFSVDSIAVALKKILGFTPAERERMVLAGQRRASQFSWRKAAAAYLELYGELIRGAS